MVTPLFWVWGSLFGLFCHDRHQGCDFTWPPWAGFGAFGGAFVEPHGDGNQRLFITVPERRATIPCRAYRAPSCMPSSIQRSLSGPSIDRSCHLAASSGYLQLLGFQAIAHARKAGRGHALVSLLTRKALTNLGRSICGVSLPGVSSSTLTLFGTIKTAVVGRQRYNLQGNCSHAGLHQHKAQQGLGRGDDVPRPSANHNHQGHHRVQSCRRPPQAAAHLPLPPGGQH